MMRRRLVVAGATLLFACGAASAQPVWHRCHDAQWRAGHEAIYRLENRVAFLQADPEIDDGDKASIVTGARADVTRLHATLPPPDWRWASPCCYSRRPLHIR